MPILKQEEYKGYIIQAGEDIFHSIWYKILVDKPRWVSLRSMIQYPDIDTAISKAKKYIDEYKDVLDKKAKKKIKDKIRKIRNSINNGANLPDGDEWSDYAATESDF